MMGRGGLYRATVATCLGLAPVLVSCTYLQHAAKQSEYSRIQAQSPSQLNLKHMIDRQNFLVYGRIVDASDSYPGVSFGVAAFSDRYRDNELVDATPMHRANTHYGLNLPAGDYELLVLADLDHSGTLDQTEVVGRELIILNDEAYPQRVVGNVDIALSPLDAADWAINMPIPAIVPSRESLFYPKGTLRDLNDQLFDTDFAALGMYEPAAFLEVAPTMFYALEEDSFKVPVIFVHGIGGSAREFASIVSRLDRQLFMPWFFYYPSGSDLDQMAEIFYNIFLSGNAVPWSTKPMVIVAHSMGGLVVREAINKYQATGNENRVELLITIATPFGGHPAAAMGEKRSPLVLPSWRDLNPEGVFIDRLYRKPLPTHLSHQLLYTYGNPGTLKLGENSDGVVPLSSQLYPQAQLQAAGQFGFNTSHTGVLKDEHAIQQIVDAISQVGVDLYPQSHIDALIAGGFDVDLDASYSDTEKYFIRTMGNFMALLANGTLDPLGDPILEHFALAAQGDAKAKTDPETAWLKFIQDYPHYGD